VQHTTATQDTQAGRLVHTLCKQPVLVDHLRISYRMHCTHFFTINTAIDSGN
jgi:hypothetical protein